MLGKEEVFVIEQGKKEEGKRRHIEHSCWALIAEPVVSEGDFHC